MDIKAIKIQHLINLKKISFLKIKTKPIVVTIINKIVLMVGFKETKKFKKTAIKDKIHAPKKIEI